MWLHNSAARNRGNAAGRQRGRSGNTCGNRTIAHGMLVLATISEMMAASLGEAWLRGGKLKVRLKAPAKTTDRLTASAKALSASAAALERDDGAIQRYAVECRNQDGDLLISGTAQVPAGG